MFFIGLLKYLDKGIWTSPKILNLVNIYNMKTAADGLGNIHVIYGYGRSEHPDGMYHVSFNGQIGLICQFVSVLFCLSVD